MNQVNYAAISKLILSISLLMVLSVANADRDEDTPVLDVDASGTVTPLTDGLMILRSMFGFTDDALTDAAVDVTNCEDCDSEEIEEYIADIRGLTFGKINSADDQNISGSALNGTTLTIGIENGESESVDLSGLIDGVGITSDQADSIVANTAKTGITSDQASAIAANTAKTGITADQASAITANTAKTGITSDQADAITANTAKIGITSDQASAITANTAKTGITSDQASAITANTAKTGITSDQASAITANTAKTGITSDQASAITANTAKTGITSDQASAITANTAKTGITSDQASAITENTAKTGITSDQASAIAANTAKTGITSDQANAIAANSAKIGITTEQANAIAINTSKSSTVDQNISGSGLSGTTLTIGIEGGSSETVSLSSLQDGTGTDDQNISGSGLSGTTLTIGIEGGNSQAVDLSSLSSPFKGEWSEETTYAKGNMVLYRNRPFWSLTDSNQGTKPGSENPDCSFWNSSSFANWVGVNGYSTLSCTFTARITDNDFFGQDGSTYYFVPNQDVGAYENSATISGATLTMLQPITVTKLSLTGDLMPSSGVFKAYSMSLIVDSNVVETFSGSIPSSGNAFSANLTVTRDIDIGSKISLALSLGGRRFLDTTSSPDGAFVMQLEYTQ